MCLLQIRTTPIKKKVIVRTFSISSFYQYGRRQSSRYLAVIVSPLERLAEVRRFEISHIPLQLLLKGLLGEGEAG